jgi:O-antigen/teichoic acid export membrane protein
VLGNGIGSTVLNASFYFIFAAMLSPEEYGSLSYLIAIAGTGSVISQFGFPQSVTVYQSKGKMNLANQINVIGVILSVTVSLILLTINIFASVLSFSLAFFILNQHNLLGLKKYKSFFWAGLFKGLLVISLPIAFYFLVGIPGVILGMALSNLICSFHFIKNLKLNFKSLDEFKSNFQFILHNFSIQASFGFAKFLDKLVIVPILGFASTGIYQFNLQILLALTILPSSLHSFLLSEESSGTTHKKINYLVIITSILLVMISILFAPFAVENLFPKYVEGIPSLQIILVSLIPMSISSIINPKLQSKESTLVGYPAISRIVSLIIFIIILGGSYGLLGLSLSVLFSSIIEVLLLLLIFYRVRN